MNAGFASPTSKEVGHPDAFSIAPLAIRDESNAVILSRSCRAPTAAGPTHPVDTRTSTVKNVHSEVMQFSLDL